MTAAAQVRLARASMLRARSIWRGSLLCDAHISARSASSKPQCSSAPVSTTASACAGFAAERASVMRAGSPNEYSRRPLASTTATCARCVFSIDAPR